MKLLQLQLNLLVLLFVAGVSAQTKYEKDFLEFWNDYNDNYAYFEQQGIDWQKVKDIYLPAASKIGTDTEFVEFLEQVVNELHNGHVSLNTNLQTSNRIIPSGADVYAEMKNGKFYITDVRHLSAADVAGLQPGMELVAFNGQEIRHRMNKFLPKHTSVYTPKMYAYALNMLLAGSYDTKRQFTVRNAGAVKDYYPDNTAAPAQPAALLEVRILAGNIGYIKINNTLWNNNLIPAFDKALDSLLSTKSLILDLTETPGGGNTTVARAIMGRFITKERPYQKHMFDEKEYGTVRSWVEYVLPRGQTYRNKVVVMVGHWTGSMGEGLAIGFDGMQRAEIVGTKMAGLIGAIYTFSASETKVGYQIPPERLYHINGTPREDFIPEHSTANGKKTYAKAVKLAR